MNIEQIKQDWDNYWNKKDTSSNLLYDILAEIYRKLIITNILTYFVKKHFIRDKKILHAGCGSGQVDKNIRNYIDITALDISENALKLYTSIYGAEAKTIQGDIFNLPFQENTFDGLYNLGVMEHFTQSEIGQILTEFKRVVKPNGTLIILWPPKFGFSVIVLDTIHFILNKVFRLNVNLHPDEITRIKSKKHAIDTFQKSGFEVINYYFGIKDFFTQVVIVSKNVK